MFQQKAVEKRRNGMMGSLKEAVPVQSEGYNVPYHWLGRPVR